jgi:ABC-type nitrate/sulfonate/bicarbonate transport system permease component
VTVLQATPGAATPESILTPPRAAPGGNRAARAARRGVKALITIVVVLAIWQGFLEVFHVSSYVGKGPLDVWRYLFTVKADGAVNQLSAAGNRTAILHESGTTLRDAGLGLAGGTVAALGASVGFHLWRLASQAFMPIALTLRSVPLVAMTPLIVVIFGQTLLAITVIAGIVTFFPTLVNVTLALDRTPKETIDLCRAYGAGAGTTLLKVEIPAALPALFASLRIAAPLALVGALLAEWLATGTGLGYTMLTAGNNAQYDAVWARVVVVTVYAVVLYLAVGVLERIVLARFGHTDA